MPKVGAMRHVPLLLFLVLVLLGGGGPAPLVAQQNTAREISESQRRLAEIRRERTKLRSEMQQIRSRVQDVTSEVRNIERQVSTSAELLNEIETQIGQLQLQIGKTTHDLQLMQERLAHRQGVLHRRLREIYKRGPLHTTQVLLAAESFSDLLNRYKYLYLITRQDQALVAEITGIKDELVLREQALREDAAQLEALKRERASEHQQLARLENQRKRTLAGLQTQERTVVQRERRLEQDERRLTSLMAELERRRKEAERVAEERRRAAAAAAARSAAAGNSGGNAAARPAPAPTAPAAASAGTLSSRSMGTLPWPHDGRVIYRFGRVVQPNGTAIRMNGIGIGGPAGSAVRAVEAGTVVLASEFEGYGPTVVVSHGGGYYTLYLYLREISVREGADVTRGQALGTMGGSGRPEGAHVEFQIRTPGGQAVDPLAWLRKRGG